jgi:hypothetical protein
MEQRVWPKESMLIAITAARQTTPARRPMRLVRGQGDAATFAVPSRSSAAIAAVPELPAALWREVESDDPRRDREAQESAEQILGDLDRVQVDLLSGRVDLARLRRIGILANTLAAADPGLDDICKAIVVRARVEVARIECSHLVGAPRRRWTAASDILFR